MAQQQIRGSTQIKDNSIPEAKLAFAVSKPDGSAAWTGNHNAGGNRLTNLGNAVADGDAINLGQAKQLLYGVLYTRVARAAATGNVNVASPGTNIFDGVALNNGDVLFLFQQTNAAENGLYVFNGAASALTRTVDADGSSEVQPGLQVFVSEGTTYGNRRYRLITDAPIVVGTTALTFVEESGGGTYTAGDGLQLVGNTFSVVAKPSSGITVDGAGVGTDPAVVAHVADLVFGEVPAGVVNGTNTTFTLANQAVGSSVRVYQNGLRLREGAGNDYTFAGDTLTFNTPPASGDVILVDYIVSHAT